MLNLFMLFEYSQLYTLWLLHKIGFKSYPMWLLFLHGSKSKASSSRPFIPSHQRELFVVELLQMALTDDERFWSIDTVNASLNIFSDFLCCI